MEIRWRYDTKYVPKSIIRFEKVLLSIFFFLEKMRSKKWQTPFGSSRFKSNGMYLLLPARTIPQRQTEKWVFTRKSTPNTCRISSFPFFLSSLFFFWIPMKRTLIPNRCEMIPFRSRDVNLRMKEIELNEITEFLILQSYYKHEQGFYCLVVYPLLLRTQSKGVKW